MKWIEDLDFGRFRTQGIVAVGVFIRMFTVSWLLAGCRQTTPDGSVLRARFFLPIKVLSRVFRGKFVAGLKAAFQAGTLQFHGSLRHLAEPRTFASWLRTLFRQDWVVYAKRPFGGPQHALRYLGAYTHRVAISNHRLVALEDGNVTFRWRDSAHGNKKKLMTLPVDEFLRRFLLHLLPRGFVRIRHFGFLANRRRASLLPICFQLLSLSSRTSAASKGRLPNSTEFHLALPTLRRNHAHRRTNLRGRTAAPFSAAESQACSMNRSPHLDPSAFIGAHREVPSHFGLQRLPAAVIAARSALQGPASIDHQGRTAPIRSQTETMSRSPAFIGAFKLHKRPPPHRLPSSRCI